MNDTTKHIELRINKSELDVIIEITVSKTDLYDFKQIKGKEYKLIFENIDNAIELDKLIKDKLIYKGFDIDYNPTQFGRICENLIDKFYEILK